MYSEQMSPRRLSTPWQMQWTVSDKHWLLIKALGNVRISAETPNDTTSAAPSICKTAMMQKLSRRRYGGSQQRIAEESCKIKALYVTISSNGFASHREVIPAEEDDWAASSPTLTTTPVSAGANLESRHTSDFTHGELGCIWVVELTASRHGI